MDRQIDSIRHTDRLLRCPRAAQLADEFVEAEFVTAKLDGSAMHAHSRSARRRLDPALLITGPEIIGRDWNRQRHPIDSQLGAERLASPPLHDSAGEAALRLHPLPPEPCDLRAHAEGPLVEHQSIDLRPVLERLDIPRSADGYARLPQIDAVLGEFGQLEAVPLAAVCRRIHLPGHTSQAGPNVLAAIVCAHFNDRTVDPYAWRQERQVLLAVQRPLGMQSREVEDPGRLCVFAEAKKNSLEQYVLDVYPVVQDRAHIHNNHDAIDAEHLSRRTFVCPGTQGEILKDEGAVAEIGCGADFYLAPEIPRELGLGQQDDEP